MATTKFQIGIVNFCIFCGIRFMKPQPETEETNVITCGDDSDPTDTGCGKSFIAKVSTKQQLEHGD